MPFNYTFNDQSSIFPVFLGKYALFKTFHLNHLIHMLYEAIDLLFQRKQHNLKMVSAEYFRAPGILRLQDPNKLLRSF